jgi:hypothetical protein
MAVHDDLFVPGKLVHAIPEFLKREKTGALDSLRSVLLGCPYVKKKKVPARFHHLIQFSRAYILASVRSKKHGAPPCFHLDQATCDDTTGLIQIFRKLEQWTLSGVFSGGGSIGGMAAPNVQALIFIYYNSHAKAVMC